MLRTTIAALAAVALSTTALANSPELQRTTIPATACQIVGPGGGRVHPVLTTGSWDLWADGPALITCPVSVANGTVDSFRVLYRDPDGRRGRASVKVRTLAFAPLSSLDGATGTCTYASNLQGPIAADWTVATVTCSSPITIHPGIWFGIQIELWRRGLGGFVPPSFAGIDFP